jgi:hypothetical protein
MGFEPLGNSSWCPVKNRRGAGRQRSGSRGPGEEPCTARSGRGCADARLRALQRGVTPARMQKSALPVRGCACLIPVLGGGTRYGRPHGSARLRWIMFGFGRRASTGVKWRLRKGGRGVRPGVRELGIRSRPLPASAHGERTRSHTAMAAWQSARDRRARTRPPSSPAYPTIYDTGGSAHTYPPPWQA